MNPQDAVDLGRHALFVSLLLGAPVLLVGVAVGLVVGLLQALTQVQDQTISFVPKIVAMAAALALCLPWLIHVMIDYCQMLAADIPRLIGGG